MGLRYRLIFIRILLKSTFFLWHVDRILYQYPGSSYPITPLSLLFGGERDNVILRKLVFHPNLGNQDFPPTPSSGYFPTFELARKDEIYMYTSERRDSMFPYTAERRNVLGCTFSHPQQGRIDFNTVNPSLSTGMDFLIHPCR